METARKSVSNPERCEAGKPTLVERLQAGMRYQLLKLFPSFEKAERIIAMGDRRADVVTSALQEVRAVVQQYQCSPELGERLIPNVLRHLEKSSPFHFEYIPRRSHFESNPPCTNCSARDPSFPMCTGDPTIYGCDTIGTEVIDQEASLLVVPERR